MFAATGNAQCGFSTISKAAAAWPDSNYQQEREASEMPQPSLQGPQMPQDPSIVGLWKITFVSGGQVVDQGFDQWNIGGTEILNDTPPPATGNVCLGVWVQTGRFTYKLKHPSWTFDNGGNLNGTVIIREQPILDPRGNTFEASFTLDVYDLSGNLLEHAAGTITGQRITVD
jgi:hypothetical protein